MSVALRILIGLVLLGLLLWAFGSADIGARLRSAEPTWMVAAIACLLAQTALMAWRWQLVGRCLGLHFSLGWALREYLVAQIVNLTVPGGMVGDGARAVRSRAGEQGLKRAAQAVVLERAAGQVGLLVVGAAGLGWAVLSPHGLSLPPDLARGIAVAGLCVVAVGAFAFAFLRRGRIAALVSRCLPTGRIKAAHATLSLGAALLNVAAFAACARAVGVVLSPGAALLIVPLILTAMVIPLGIAGWGWREGAAAALFPVAGAAGSAGVAAGILFGVAMMIAAAPGIPLLIRGEKTGVRDRGRGAPE
ncbi:flippase-like domain-containing protein [Palleronia sediminis]|uniref:Flippase-like domain-containing protein n=2 Tax=Palleronia sediminis TaxID=2547833 RepID=A0A4R6AEI3_9RHOB|nr:flippase-like domain-containing protein [Palleronia sediminis]